jgi:hypothetical protein
MPAIKTRGIRGGLFSTKFPFRPLVIFVVGRILLLGGQIPDVSIEESRQGQGVNATSCYVKLDPTGISAEE